MNNLKNSDSMPKLASFTGAIDYPLMNDYMFRSVMQSNKNVLKELLCFLLHLDPANVREVQILNPIELGKKISDKEFILDIKILMNNNTVINLEMQMNNQYNWPERSLIYLSRLFDSLNAGEAYKTVKPAFQIGILNFTPFPEHSEFFSTYKMMNIKNYYKYSEKYIIHVLDLTQIHLADREDKDHDLDKWAKLFRALAWEDFKMISEGNKSMQEAGETLFTLNRDDRIRDLCEAREDYRRTWEGVKLEMDELKLSNKEKTAVIEEKDTAITEFESLNEKKDTLIASLEAQAAELQLRLQSN